MNGSVLFDTSALCAIAAPADPFHSEAMPAYQSLVRRHGPLYLTSYVLLETTATLHLRLGFPVLKKMIEAITPVTSVYWIDQSIHDQAWNLLVSRNGAGPSLVDWTTILVAKSLGALVFTFDRHFEAEGLSVIPRKA